MNKLCVFKKSLFVLLFLMHLSFFYAQENQPPVVIAEGNQVFCPGNAINIVTNFTITDTDDTTIDSFFIQISSGYQIGFDRLQLTGSHPTILSVFLPTQGKLTLFASNSREMLLTDLENAVKDIVFTTSATNITPEKAFSLSIGDANYLPITDRFYEFVPALGITWTDAKIAAENRTYFGRNGYLATLTSREEAEFAGKQTSGAGWIGGSDEEIEGVWKWVTGPEAGQVFWRGLANGIAVGYANWNNNEPNNFENRNEDYVHITALGVGVFGSWNDLTNTGDTSGNYQPKGYVVEYGIPSDPPLSIVATTRIYIPLINTITSNTICESGFATVTATATEGEIIWYDALTGGTEIGRGNSYTSTSSITNSTSFYAAVSVNGCTTATRTIANIIVNPKPIIISTTDDLICSGIANLSAVASKGTIFWYDNKTSTTPIFSGENYTTPNLTSTKSYFVEANNAGCISSSRTEIKAVVDGTTPRFDLVKKNYTLCKDIGFVFLETTKSDANYTYIWKKDGSIIPGNESTLSINSNGNYSVSAVSDAGCISTEQLIVVTESEAANITKGNVLITNNTLQVTYTNLGIGLYEFALDDEFGLYTENGFFTDIATGIHTLFVKDKKGCATARYNFSILGFPNFFTPNSDGLNDEWKIDGLDSNLFTISDIYIYNRLGILIHKINPSIGSWDGKYKGKTAPATTYWFRAILTDTNGRKIEKIGYFSLIIN